MKLDRQPSTKKNLIDYSECFASLRVRKIKDKGKAPHQPILLLSVIDLIAQGIISENKIFPSDTLKNTFDKYWQIFPSNYVNNFEYPFCHLQTKEFWHLTVKSQFNKYSLKALRQKNIFYLAVEYATLDEELFELIQNPDSRTVLVDILLSTWFLLNKQDIQEIIDINNCFHIQEEQEAQKTIDESVKFYLKKSLIRNAVFRKSIVHLYEYKCALCHLKVTQSFTQSIVDGAHIKPFAKFYDNKIDNGLSLCKNHHWAFDQGLFTIDDSYKVMVANSFEEISPNARSITDFRGEQILLPKSHQYFPRLEAIQWHRQNIFRNS